MSTIIIKHKSSNMFSNEQAPGKGKQGIAGDTGLSGTDGKMLYFTNYNLNNSYYQDLCLQRIENNVILSNNRNGTLGNREYGDGDIIIAYNKEVYMICKNDSENSNYKFYLKYIGEILEKSDATSISERIQYINIIPNKSSNSMVCMIPSNRSYSTSDYTSDTVRKLLGFGFNANLIVDSIDCDTDYDFSLEIKLKNERNIILDAYKRFCDYSDIANGNEQSFTKFDFYKKIEIPLTINNSSNSPIFISDMICDKLHPSGNEISSTYMDSSDAIVVNLIGSTYYGYDSIMSKSNGNYDILGTFEWLDGSKESAAQTRTASMNTSFKGNNSFALNGIDVCSDYRDLRNSNYYAVNYRSGESAYFSGIQKNSERNGIFSTSGYVKTAIEGTDDNASFVFDAIKNFIFSKNNIYTLLYRNKNTKEVKRIVMPFETIKIIEQ